MRVKVEVDSDEEEQLIGQWLKAVEERCPVSDNIGSLTPVNITLAE